MFKNEMSRKYEFIFIGFTVSFLGNQIQKYNNVII